MTATKEDIQYWLRKAIKKEATHLIIAVDKFDWDNYPVYVSPNENVKDEIERITSSRMQGIDEIYNMSIDINKQLLQNRAYNI